MIQKKAQTLTPYTGEEEAPPSLSKPKTTNERAVPVATRAPEQVFRPAPSFYHTDTGSNAVISMQKEMIALYNTFKSKPEVAEWFSKDKESSSGKDTFLQFMLNRYVGKAKQQGEQYDLSMPSAKDYTTLPKSSFLQYLAMLSVVGKHTTREEVSTPDGIWGKYTDNALRAAWSIAYSMTTLANNLGEKFSFTKEDLESFKELVPQSPGDSASLSVEEKNELAKNIIPFLQKLRKSVNDFVAIMIDVSHKYSTYISEDKKFNVFKPEKASEMSEKDVSSLEKLKSNEIQNVFVADDLADGSGEKHPITFNDILSKDNIILFLKTNNIKINNRNSWEGHNLSAAINYIKRQVSNVMAKAKTTFEPAGI